MKKLLWTSAMALTAAACMTACDDSSSGASNSIPEFKTEAALPDTCEMEVAKAGDTYFACFENKWIEVTDSATVEQLKEGLDEDEVKAKLEELEDLLKPVTPAKPKSSSSKKTDEDVESSDSEEPESSSSEECTGRRCKTGNSSSSKKSSGGNGGSGSGDSGEGGSGEGGDSSPSSTDSSGDSSPSSVSSSSLKRHVNFSVLDNFVEWNEDGITATFAVTTSGATLATKIQDAGFENTFVTSSSMTKDNELLKTLGSDWRVESNNLLSMMNVQTVKDSSIYVIIITYPQKGKPVYTEIIPMGKCGTKAYSKKGQFCSNGTAYPLCNGKTYDPTEQFCDTRGTGTLYKYVTIGEQVWMAENLNYETASGSYCYEDEPENCETYGRVYNWSAATEACPTGWDLPSLDDWSDLTAKSGYSYKTTSYRKSGTNETGFSSIDNAPYRLPSGSYGTYTRYWSSTAEGTDSHYYLYLGTGTSDMGTSYSSGTSEYAYPVRCIKD